MAVNLNQMLLCMLRRGLEEMIHALAEAARSSRTVTEKRTKPIRQLQVLRLKGVNLYGAGGDNEKIKIQYGKQI
jgi:hypothetical protein